MTGTYNEIRCPKCEASIFAYAEQSGETITCPRCQNQILVPGSKPKKSKDGTVDDLIDIDDDLLNPNPDGKDILARSVDEPIEVNADPVVLADELNHALPDGLSSELPEELQLAPDSVPAGPAIQSAADEQELTSGEPPKNTAMTNDDLGDLIDIPASQPIVEMNYPFQADENADLVVEGVTPSDGQFPISCNLCGSLLYARVSQVGTKIKCHDCHSLVEVTPPRSKPTPVEELAPPTDKEGGYILSEPVDLKPIDTTFDITLGDIDYDDNDFFDKQRQMSDRQRTPDDEDGNQVPVNEPNGGTEIELPDEIVVIEEATLDDMAASDDDDEYGLAPLTNNPASSNVSGAGTAFPKTTNISEPFSIESKEKPPASKSGKAPGNDRDVPVKARVERPDKDSKKSQTPNADELDYSGVFRDMKPWLKNAVTPLTDLNGLLRIVLSAAAIGACYLLILGGLSYFGEKSSLIEKFGGSALLAFGGVPLLVCLFFLGVVANPIVRISMEQRGSLTEWPEFSLSDWFSQFIYLGTSFWLAAFPGLIFGALMAMVTGNPIWLFSMIIISSMVFTPLILSSVVFNESPAALISPDVYKSLLPLKNRWMRFFIAAFGIGLFIALTVILLSFLVGGYTVLGFLIAASQVAALFVYWWILGDLTGHVVRWMSDEA